MTNSVIEVYTVGSFVRDIPTWCFSVWENGKKLIIASGKVVNKEHAKSRNIAGEIYAMCHAVKWCAKNGFLEISVLHRCESMENVATGYKEANSSIMIGLQKCLIECNLKDISWNKMDATDIRRDEIKRIAEGRNGL